MTQHAKAAIRKKMLAERAALAPDEIKKASEAIWEALKSEGHFKNARCVAFYMPIRNEVDTRGMIREAAETKEVLLPGTEAGHKTQTGSKIEFFRFTGFGRLKEGKYGIMEPVERIVPGKEPDVVIVPGVAFGLCMHRLGYGKGYYDSFLRTSAAYRIGICYDFQVLGKLPAHEDDERMELIITEKRRIAIV